MRKIVYYVATSIDGFISRPDHSIEGFVGEGSAVSKYFEDLQGFDTVIMGRKTYEFGYQFGLKPGQPAYPHMKHYIFSSSLSFDDPHENVVVNPLNLDFIRTLKNESGTDIYLCGGGEFAGWLLEEKQVDILKLKLNPLVLGKGIRLFGSSIMEARLHLIDSQQYEKGLQIMTFNIQY